MHQRLPILPFATAIGAAALVVVLTSCWLRWSTAPVVVVLCDATVGSPDTSPDRGAPDGPPPQPFSLDDLGRGLLALTTEPTERHDLATRLGGEIRQLVELRATLEHQAARRRDAAAALTAAALDLAAVLDRRQIDAVLDAAIAGWGTRDDPWEPLKHRIEEGS
jgi:hypothetical protein